MSICQQINSRCVSAEFLKRGRGEGGKAAAKKERDENLEEEKSFGARRRPKENKKCDRLQKMERKRQSLEEKLEKMRRDQPKDIREERFTLEKTKDQRDIEEEMERLIEEHKNDPPTPASQSDRSEKMEDLDRAKTWMELGREDLEEEMNASELESGLQLQEDGRSIGGTVDSKDIFAKYSHVLQGTNDFDLSESDEEKTAEMSHKKSEEDQIRKARDNEEMRRRRENEIAMRENMEEDNVDMDEELVDDGEDEVVKVDDNQDEVEEDSVCKFTALNAGRADEVRLSETDSDSVPLEVRISSGGSDREVVKDFTKLDPAEKVVVTLDSDTEEAGKGAIGNEIYGFSSSLTRINNPFNVLLETREEQIQSREDAEAANALALDMDERGEEDKRRGSREEEERKRLQEEDERMRRREEEDVLRRVEEEEMRKVANEHRIQREKEEMLTRRDAEERGQFARVQPEVTPPDIVETQYFPEKMTESVKAKKQDVGKMKVGKKQARCGTCQGCTSPNCNVCKFCKDMKSNGGEGKQR